MWLVLLLVKQHVTQHSTPQCCSSRHLKVLATLRSLPSAVSVEPAHDASSIGTGRPRAAECKELLPIPPSAGRHTHPEPESKSRCGLALAHPGCAPRAATSRTLGSPELAPEPALGHFATSLRTRSRKMRKLWDSQSAPKRCHRRPSHARASGGFQST